MVPPFEDAPGVGPVDRVGIAVRDCGVAGEVAITATVGLTLESSSEKGHSPFAAMALGDERVLDEEGLWHVIVGRRDHESGDGATRRAQHEDDGARIGKARPE